MFSIDEEECSHQTLDDNLLEFEAAYTYDTPKTTFVCYAPRKHPSQLDMKLYEQLISSETLRSNKTGPNGQMAYFKLANQINEEEENESAKEILDVEDIGVERLSIKSHKRQWSTYCSKCNIKIPMDKMFYSNVSQAELYESNALVAVCQDCMTCKTDEHFEVIMETGFENLRDWIFIVECFEKCVFKYPYSSGTITKKELYAYFCCLNPNSKHYKRFAIMSASHSWNGDSDYYFEMCDEHTTLEQLLNVNINRISVDRLQ